jgi:hypothetical protein
MNIVMTIIAVGSGFRKNQRLMTLPAVSCGMLTNQWHFCFVMIKGIYGLIKFPSF